MYSSGGMVYSSGAWCPNESCQACVFIVSVEQCKLVNLHRYNFLFFTAILLLVLTYVYIANKNSIFCTFELFLIFLCIFVSPN